MNGTAEMTKGDLRKEDLVVKKNKAGTSSRIVSRKKSASATKGASPHIKLMNKAREIVSKGKSKSELKQLFVAGSAINKERSKVYEELKEEVSYDAAREKARGSGAKKATAKASRQDEPWRSFDDETFEEESMNYLMLSESDKGKWEKAHGGKDPTELHALYRRNAAKKK